MRLTLAVLILMVSPLSFGRDKGVCKDRCGSNYQFCMNRATTKQAKKSCKADLKTCRHSCK